MEERALAYLERRVQCWYAGHDIPADVQPILGRKRFFQSLRTRDKEQAKRDKAVLEAKWRDDIERARRKRLGASYAWSPLSDLEAYRRHARFAALAPEERERERELVQMEVYEPGGLMDSEAGQRDGAQEQARRFVAIATGELTATDEHVEEYLASPALKVKPKTLDIKRNNLRKLAKRFPHLSDVKRREVQRWVAEMAASGMAPKSLARDLSDMRGYWRWLQTMEFVPDDVQPFQNLQLPRTEPDAERRQPFEAADVVKLLAAARGDGDDGLADLIELGMWTGCRIEELAALKVEHVHAKHFEVVASKTNAGRRDVPIHPKLAPTMTRLVRASRDGYVLSGLTPNKYGDRSNAVGKRFGRLKSDLGFGPQHVFHSLRKTVITLLENAGVPEPAIQDIVGHKRESITLGTYSGGLTLQNKAKYLGRLKYPEL